MKKKNIKLIIIVAIIILIFWAFAFFMIYNIMQRSSLITEFEEITELTSEDYETMDIEEINMRLDRTISSGKYAEVEKSAKQYLKDVFKNTEEMSKILNDPYIAHSLTIDNYKEDGPDFKETKEYLTKTKQELQNGVDTYKEFFTEEKIMSYINDKNLSEFYKKFYREKIMGDPANKEDIQLVEDSINEVIDALNKSEDVIDFLIKNKYSWTIEGENIVFNDNKTLDQYNILIMKLL